MGYGSLVAEGFVFDMNELVGLFGDRETMCLWRDARMSREGGTDYQHKTNVSIWGRYFRTCELSLDRHSSFAGAYVKLDRQL